MPSNVAQNALTLPTAQAVDNQKMPAGGPKVIPLGPFNFGTTATYSINLTTQQQQNKIDIVQCLFIDNSANTSNLVVTANVSGQSITAAPQTQGYYPMLAVQPVIFTVSSAGTVNAAAAVYCLNVPIAPCIWSSISSAGALLTQPVSDAILDAIVSGGKAQVSNYVFGQSETSHPMHISDVVVTALVTTTATTTLLTGAPSFFISSIDIALSGNATLAVAGTVNFQLVDSNASTVIWQRTVALATTQIAGLTSVQLASLTGLNINSKGSLSTLQFRQSPALQSGTVSINLGAGISTDIT